MIRNENFLNKKMYSGPFIYVIFILFGFCFCFMIVTDYMSLVIELIFFCSGL